MSQSPRYEWDATSASDEKEYRSGREGDVADKWGADRGNIRNSPKIGRGKVWDTVRDGASGKRGKVVTLPPC